MARQGIYISIFIHIYVHILIQGPLWLTALPWPYAIMDWSGIRDTPCASHDASCSIPCATLFSPKPGQMEARKPQYSQHSTLLPTLDLYRWIYTRRASRCNCREQPCVPATYMCCIRLGGRLSSVLIRAGCYRWHSLLLRKTSFFLVLVLVLMLYMRRRRRRRRRRRQPCRSVVPALTRRVISVAVSIFCPSFLPQGGPSLLPTISSISSISLIFWEGTTGVYRSVVPSLLLSANIYCRS